MTTSTTINDILESAMEDLEEQYEAGMQYPEDLVAEIADASVPVYTNTLIEVGTSDHSLLTNAPELGPASGTNFTGEATVINIIAANIYEAVSNALHEKLHEMQEEELDEAA